MITDAGSYRVIIEKGSLGTAGRYVSSVTGGTRCVTVSDDTVYGLYGRTLENSLRDAGIDVAESFVFPHGEVSKNMSVLGELLDRMCEVKLSRRDMVVALGGGVTGDLAGFAAAVYMRGIRHVQIPTTLLAMADSSVGGKTAVDSRYGKNLIGAFHEPSLVICDPELLSTLPREYFTDGMAEVIKTGFVCDPVLIGMLEKGTDEGIEDMIGRCVSDKAGIVSGDLCDRGERQKLNFGHTAGHAMELLSDYSVGHGRAVASGMALFTRAAVKRGICPEETLRALMALLTRYGLDPELYRRFGPGDISSAASRDKKGNGDTLTVVLPTGTGKCSLFVLPYAELEGLIEDGYSL